MSDSQVFMNPMRILFHVGSDKDWKRMSTENIQPKLDWLFPDVPLMDDPMEELTVHRLIEKFTKKGDPDKRWTEFGLHDLKVLADSG